MNYEVVKANYVRGLWSEAAVKMALKKGVITQDQYNEIIAAKEK